MDSHAIDSDAYHLVDIPNETGTPERRLLLAVIERAILDFVGNDRKEIDEAQRWLFDEEDPALRSQFSFAWICHQLDLDVSKIAGKIKAMPKRGEKRIAPWYITKSYGDKKLAS